MREEAIIAKVTNMMNRYLRRELTGSALISEYDKMISNDEVPWDVQDHRITAIDDFQTELGFFVEDPNKRAENSAYYGENELRKKVEAFLRSLAAP
jgi:hypothetical protein